MKKIIISFFLLLIFNVGKAQKVTFLSILEDIAKIALQVREDQVMTYQNVFNKETIVNSVSNANFSGGVARKIFKINIPQNTVRWYYRVTVLDKTQGFRYQPNETLHYSLINKIDFRPFNTNSISMNMYFVSSSGDANNFLLSRSFKYDSRASSLSTNSCFGISDLIGDNIWLGIENLSYMDGAKVIIEVVALTRSARINQNMTAQSKKQIADAKELFELGVINKKSYDSVIQLYSPKISRQEAIDRLKESKRQLDSNIISQKEYDILLQFYSPIIKGQ